MIASPTRVLPLIYYPVGLRPENYSASGEPLCVRQTFPRPENLLRLVPSESLVASGASRRHGPLSPSTQSNTAHPGPEFTFYVPGPPHAQGARGMSVCNPFFLLLWIQSLDRSVRDLRHV